VESLGNFPDTFFKEISGQPAALRRAAAALLEQRDGLEGIREAAEAAKNLVFTGMGSSYDACYPAVNDLASRGISALLVDTAELLHFRQPILNGETFLTIVSQSGASAEIVKLAVELRTQRTRPFVLTITNGLSNPLARHGDVTLDTWAGPETAPSTMTFAAAVAQLASVASLLAGASVDTSVDRTRAAAEDAACGVERLLQDAHGWAEELAGWLGDCSVIVILGRGPARGAAEMGALLLKESGVMAESLESAAFRHGPFELAGPGLAAIVLATEPETRSLDLGLAQDLVEAGASVLVITPDGEAPRGALAAATGYQDRALFSAVSIVPVQLLAWRLSAKRGRIPGTFTRAFKVTTRE
jgi:glutamine---fructose-6-phosphate transaminase (isomerizing)